MEAHRRPRRRGWVVVVGCVAAASLMCLTASGAASAGGPAAAHPATPTVNPDYLYSQLYAMSKAFSYRISGADGDPRNAADRFNLPPTVNGWNELFAYWKAHLTDRRVNTKLARFATGTDHYIPRTGGYRVDSGNAQVNNPRAPCARQRAL